MHPSPHVDLDQLTALFRESEKPPAQWRIGMEAEKFGFRGQGFEPLCYEGPSGVGAIFDWLSNELGWSPLREIEQGPVLALQRGEASLTLEPGAQLELSGSPFGTVHEVADEYAEHLHEMQRVGQVFGTWFAHVGFHPTANLAELPWVPKLRYPIMRRYLPSKGARGLDMMQRTSTVQVNLDYASEADAMRKLLVLLRLVPLVQAMTLNSPFIEGRRSELLSERLDVWLEMDPARSGLLLALWDKPGLGYQDYVEWALDAGMFLLLRDGQVHANTGQTFREYLRDGFDGLRATAQDWRTHLGTLFPEVRLKSTLEVRCCDCLPPALALSVPALCVGLTYDSTSLDRAAAVAERVRADAAVPLQRAIARQGLRTPFDGATIQRSCLELLEIAHDGLERRQKLDASGRSESMHLAPLRELTARGQTPADLLLAEFERTGSVREVFAPRTD